MKRSLQESQGDRTCVTLSGKGDGIICNELPCNGTYVPIELYPSHVDQFHDHICISCQKNFGSGYMLELHLEECHNDFRSTTMVQCFEATCNTKFSSHKDRILHLKDVHYYPDCYHFDVIYNGCSL